MDWIFDRLNKYGKDQAIMVKDQVISYEQLCMDIKAWRHELKRNDIQPGETIAFIGDYSPTIVSLFFAAILNKNIVVPLTPETHAKHSRFFKVANVAGVFTFDENNLKWSFSRIEVSEDHALLRQIKNSDEPGLVLFTSGTSGESKGAVIPISNLFEKFNCNTENARRALRTLVFLKLDHIGGVNTLFSILLNGGTVVSVGERSPVEVCRVIETHRIELLPTTPTFLNMLLLSEMYEIFDLSSLKLITYGTEPMPSSTLKAMNRVFKDIKFKQTYGLTELGIFSTKSKDSTSDWLKIGGEGVQLKVVDNILYIKCKTAMLGYLNAPSPFTEDGWYNTGDKVEVDGEYYRILGRESEIINVGGEKVFPAEVESVLLEIENIKEALVQGKINPVTGQLVIAKVVLNKPEPSRELNKRIALFCSDRLEAFKVPKLVLVSNQSFVSDRLKKSRNM